MSEQAAHEIEKLIRIQLANSYRNELRPAQWQALRFFARADPRDRTLTGFARHRRSTMGTTSITVSQLVDRGYLERGDPSGQRNVDLRVSEKGLKTLEHDPIKELEDALDRLPEQQRDQLLAGLRLVNETLDPHNNDASTG
ncbi:MAG: MarR family winged helix-turn-helix transcriptional regulator [Rhodovibrio sp.]|nr:MarR family winged helix-turn-helix transcriptional regulator [Rhodovibrio sp.]